MHVLINSPHLKDAYCNYAYFVGPLYVFCITYIITQEAVIETASYRSILLCQVNADCYYTCAFCALYIVTSS